MVCIRALEDVWTFFALHLISGTKTLQFSVKTFFCLPLISSRENNGGRASFPNVENRAKLGTNCKLSPMLNINRYHWFLFSAKTKAQHVIQKAITKKKFKWNVFQNLKNQPRFLHNSIYNRFAMWLFNRANINSLNALNLLISMGLISVQKLQSIGRITSRRLLTRRPNGHLRFPYVCHIPHAFTPT